MSRSSSVDLFRLECGKLNKSDSFGDEDETLTASECIDRTRLVIDDCGECDESLSLREQVRNRARNALSSMSSSRIPRIMGSFKIIASVAALTVLLHAKGLHRPTPPPREVVRSQLPQPVKPLPPRPTLHTLIGDFEADVKADVQWLMDFAIIGHSKCATTAQQLWLRNHPEIVMHDYEVHSLRKGRPAEMVSLLYTLPEKPTGANRLKHGYKEPNDIRSSEALRYIRKYWPHTRLILGVRHPVKWFESYYNYNTRNNHSLPPAEEMVGENLPDHARFHLHLSQLGKTRLSDARERELLGRPAGNGTNASSPDDEVSPPHRMRNKVFLYETSQPFDSREGRDVTYREDLAKFLNLTTPLPPIKVRNKPSPNYHYAIDICDDRFRELRAQLVEDGRVAAEWITEYFLKHPDVTVSSPDHFVEVLRSWSLDPCDAAGAR